MGKKQAKAKTEAMRVAKPDVEELRAEFMERASQAFDRMFAAKEQQNLVTFDAREGRAVEIAHDLGRFVLGAHVQRDEAARPDPEMATTCPLCGGPSKAMATPRGEPPIRQLLSKLGFLEVAREEFTCSRCRRRLFPPRPKARTRRRVQADAGIAGQTLSAFRGSAACA